MKKETTKSTEAVVENNEAQANPSVFAQASTMDNTQALNILIQTANVAQKSGVLSVNDAVLVARALELVSNGPTA
jgi:hypothetical protein